MSVVPLSPVADRDAVFALEEAILQQPQVEMPVESNFCDGVYARSMFIPAGTVATGAIHRHESFFVVRKGILIVHTLDGPMRFEAGHMSITKIGDKRAVIAITDVIVTTFHANPDNETDPQTLWDRFTIPAEVALSCAASTALEQL